MGIRFFILMIIIVISTNCKSNNRRQATQISYGEQVAFGSIDTLNIDKLMYYYISTNEVEFAEKLYGIFKSSTHGDIDFPNSQEEQDTLLKLLQTIEKNCQDSMAISLLILLDDYFKNNVEFTQRYQKTIPFIAACNIKGLLKGLSEENLLKQRRILEHLQYLPDIETINSIKSDLENIKNDSLSTTIEIAKESIELIFN